jgi:predicted regulator of Ras-like GTPase activity (Roadblock/LC7/MglB family)
MSLAAELKVELEKLASEQGVEISAVITRSGAPIAWNLPAGTTAETVATLSATIFGASEVIFTGGGWNKPVKISVETGSEGCMVTRSLGRKAILVLMSKKMDAAQLDKKATEAEIKIREMMQNE